MSLLPTKLPFDFAAIRSIKDTEDVKQWLTNFGTAFEKLYGKMYDAFIGKIVAESRGWRIIEDGDDLVFEKKIGSTWTEADRLLGS